MKKLRHEILMNKNFTTIFCITLVLTTNFYASEDKDQNCFEQAYEILEECLGISNKQRKIKFVSTVSVVLIPRREEFVAAGLKDHLWWSTSDYISFKSDATQEIKNHARAHNINIVAAIKELYQTIEPETATNVAIQDSKKKTE